MPSARTKPSAAKLSDLARHVVVPKGVESTGWPAVRDKCAELGITFDPWQHGAGRVILAKRPGGLYAAAIGGVVISIPRQVGKTFTVGGVVFALCLTTPGLTVIWTAHRLRTAGETFTSMQAMSQRKKIRPHIAKVVLGSGEEEIRFRNGSRILFGARERGFGRGFAEVDVLVFDEAQILTERAIDDMVPATNQSQQATGALVLFTGTPPKPDDPGEVFRRKRKEALSGEDEDTAYIEFSADPDADPDDPKQWAKANPSYPKRTPREAILRMRKNLSRDSFMREALGIWDEVDEHESVIPTWPDLEATVLPGVDEKPIALAVDRWYDGTTSVAAAWRTDEGVHVELVAVDVAPDPTQVIEWIAERAGRRIPVLIAGDSPAASLVAPLRARKATVQALSTAEYARACGGFLDDALAGNVTHSNQEQLNDAVSGAKKIPIGKAGAFGWDRKNPENDISALVAATLARFGAAARKKSGNGRSSNGRRAVILG